MTSVIAAAGGVVVRENAKGKLKVLAVHRPSYDDWGLPKGHADKGETPEETAVREVLEETGYHCRIVAPLETTRYRVDGGVKEVSWFLMRPLPDSPGFKKNKEVDGVRWMTRKEATSLLDYEADRELVATSGLKRMARTGTLFLLRHGTAGEREDWSGVDAARPLTKRGKKQALVIADYLKPRGIERIYTSPYARCVQSVEPLAESTGAKIISHDALAEGPDIDAAYDLADELVGSNAVICSHGDVIPALMNRMMWAGLALESRFYCSKGSIWEVGIEAGRFTTARYVPPPE